MPLKNKGVYFGDSMKELVVGQKVYCGLYGGKYGRIVAIHGKQAPQTISKIFDGAGCMGGSAEIEIYFENAQRSGVPEGIVRGVQWTIYDDVQTDVLPFLKELNVLKIENDQLKKEKKERADKIEQEEIKVKFNFKTFEETRKYGATHTAINIRQELKQTYKNLKFKVTSESSTVCVTCPDKCDEETRLQVENLLCKWKDGYYDGLLEYYVYSCNNFNKVFGGCRYINVY